MKGCHNYFHYYVDCCSGESELTKPPKNCSEVCIDADNYKDNIYHLNALKGYIDRHKEKYPEHEHSFMHEHLNSYILNEAL